MKSILEGYLTEMFPKSNLNAGFCEVDGEMIYADLALTIERNSKNMLKHAVNISLDIYNQIFDSTEIVWVLVNGWDNPIPTFVLEQFQGSHNKSIKWTSFDECYGWEREQIFYIQKHNEINLKNIFTGIINCAQGVEPRIDNRIYFINSKIHVAFILWDSGISIISNQSNNAFDILGQYQHLFK